MIEHVNNLKFQYLVELSKQGERFRDYHARVSQYLVENDVVFGNQPIPFLLMPHFLSPRQFEVIRRVVKHLSSVLEKFIASYLRDPRFKELMRITDDEDALYRIDPGYPNAVTICRLDAFLASYEVKFLEFNADSPAGIGYSDTLYEGLSRTLDLPDVHYEFEEGYEPILPHLYDAMMANYAAFRSGGREADFPAQPTVAILDWQTVITASEFRIVRRHFESRGLKVLIGDPRNLKPDAGGWPTLDGERIHLMYRRAVVREVLAKKAEAGYFLEVARDRRACIANAFRSVIAGNKKVMALILDEEWQRESLTPDEREVVRRTIPWTRILRETKTAYGGWTINLRDFVSDNRERLVMKPAKGYAGQDVFLGNETPQAKWDEVLAEAMRTEEWVVQEFIPIPQEMFPVIEGGTLQMKLKKFNINPFALRGEFAGIITRISDSSVINVTANGGLLPCCTGSIKEHIFRPA